ncbi:MAG: GtrA family protein, partial [Burkholderiales bacterium]
PAALSGTRDRRRRPPAAQPHSPPGGRPDRRSHRHLIVLRKLRASRAHTAIRFALVGLTNFVVSFTVFFLSFHYLPDAVQRHFPAAALANLLAYLAGMINSFLLNRTWTFRASGNAAAQAVRFTIVNLSSLTLSTAVMFRFVDVLHYPEIAVWVPTTVAVMMLNYLGCKHWAFAHAPRPSSKTT